MSRPRFAFSFVWVTALLVATPALGQLLNHPVMALPVGDAEGATFVGAQFARGLNDNSGKDNSFAAGVGRAMERVSFSGLVGYVASDIEELTLGANVGVHLLTDSDMPVSVSVQGGFGWASLDVLSESLSILSFPVGVAIRGRGSDSGTSIQPWVMPRVNIVRTGEIVGFASNTETDIGASAGVSITTVGGAGFHVAVDWVNVEDAAPFGLAAGVHYVLGR